MSDDQNSTQSADAPAPAFNEEQMKAISGIINSAVTSHTKRQAKEFDGKFAQILEKLSVKEAPVETVSAPASGGKSTQDGELAAMKRQIDEFKRLVDSERKQREEVEKGARNERAFNALKSELSGKVKPGALSVLVDALKARGAIAVDEFGDPVFRMPQPGSGSRDLTDYPLSTGIGEWLKQEEAKEFLPAPVTGGSGAMRHSGSVNSLAARDPKTLTTEEAFQLAVAKAATMKSNIPFE